MMKSITTVFFIIFVVIATPQLRADGRQDLQAAEAYFQNRQFDKAEEIYTRMISSGRYQQGDLAVLYFYRCTTRNESVPVLYPPDDRLFTDKEKSTMDGALSDCNRAEDLFRNLGLLTGDTELVLRITKGQVFERIEEDDYKRYKQDPEYRKKVDADNEKLRQLFNDLKNQDNTN